MRIGIDAKRILNNATGLGNHGRILLHALLRDQPQHEYLLYSPKAREEFLHEMSGDFQIYFPEGRVAQSIHPFWRSYSITDQLQRDRIDVYHGISNELPFTIHQREFRKVVTIHDLIFLKHQEQYPLIDRQIYSLKTKYAARNADHIIAVSEETKQDLIRLYQVPERSITVVYPSIDKRFYQHGSDLQKQNIKTRYQLPTQYILNVGSFFSRKNQVKLIEAFALIKDKVPHDLVLAGNGGNELAAVKAVIVNLNLQGRVHIIPNITNDDMPAVYQMASLFVFPSLMEGFGAPLVEAMVSGLPLLVSDIPCFREVGGDAAGYFTPTDAYEMSSSILTLIGNDTLSKQKIELGQERANLFSDTLFAAGVMRVYEG